MTGSVRSIVARAMKLVITFVITKSIGIGMSKSIGKTRQLRRNSIAVVLAATGLLSACGGSSGGGEAPGEVEFVPPSLPASRGLLPSLPIADAAFTSEHYSGSAQCSSCHTDETIVVPTEVKDVFRDVSFGEAWETSMMANSTRDPYWHAVVAAELHEFPMLEEEINDTCTVCHAPMANDFAKKTGQPLHIFDQGSEADGDLVRGLYGMNASDDLYNHAMDGVSCSLCHQIEAGNLGTEDSFSGGYIIAGSPTGVLEDRPAYGPYTNPNPLAYMVQQSDFTPIFSTHMSTSETCATCHNLNVEPVDEQGNPIEGIAHFSEQANHLEWLNSEYAVGGPREANCQSCHMPTLDEDVFISERGAVQRPDFSEHTFLGANTVMQDMLMNFRDELGVQPTVTDEEFEESIARNQEFLKTSAELTISAAQVDGSQVSFDVQVENNTGHKLPTGYHSRRVYLHVQVLDGLGRQVFESGAIRADGSIVGVAEDSDPTQWEMHHDVITSPTQVQVYQSIPVNESFEREHSLLRGSGYGKDNRIPPHGFDKNVVNNDPNLPPSFGVFGAAATDDDFNSGFDTVTYRVESSTEGPYTVLAELRYQPISFGHLMDLFTVSDEVDQVDMFRTMYDSTERRDEVIDAVTETIE